MDIHQLTSIFCEMDDFCNTFDSIAQHYMLSGPMKARRGPECSLAISEIMTILVMLKILLTLVCTAYYLFLLVLLLLCLDF